MASETHYNKDASINEDALADFVRGPLTTDLESVIGLGPKSAEALSKAGVENCYQLMGQFLLLRKTDMTSVEHCDAFAQWLKDNGCAAGTRSNVVRCIAEKANSMIDGIYNESEFA